MIENIITFSQNMASIQYNPALATAGTIKGTSREKVSQEIVF